MQLLTFNDIYPDFTNIPATQAIISQQHLSFQAKFNQLSYKTLLMTKRTYPHWCQIVGNMPFSLPLIWLPLATAQVLLEIGALQRVVQTTSWSFLELPTVEIDSQYWELSLSIIESDAQVALMVQTSSPPDLLNGSFTADFLDLSSWQYNLTTHILFFEPHALGNSSAYAGVYFFGSRPASSVTYQLQLKALETQFCPAGCNGRGICAGHACACQPGYVGIDCRIPNLPMSAESLITTIHSNEWRLASLQGKIGCIP